MNKVNMFICLLGQIERNFHSFGEIKEKLQDKLGIHYPVVILNLSEVYVLLTDLVDTFGDLQFDDNILETLRYVELTFDIRTDPCKDWKYLIENIFVYWKIDVDCPSHYATMNVLKADLLIAQYQYIDIVKIHTTITDYNQKLREYHDRKAAIIAELTIHYISV